MPAIGRDRETVMAALPANGTMTVQQLTERTGLPEDRVLAALESAESYQQVTHDVERDRWARR